VNGYHRRLCAAESALARLADDAPQPLSLRDPSTMTDVEAVDAFRRLAKLRIAPPAPFAPPERESILRAWKEVNGR
jgi:hypothetical protein